MRASPRDSHLSGHLRVKQPRIFWTCKLFDEIVNALERLISRAKREKGKARRKVSGERALSRQLITMFTTMRKMASIVDRDGVGSSLFCQRTFLHHI